MTATLLYLVYGADTYHREAVFSIASAFARLRETPDAALEIRVCTDAPVPYEGLPVTIMPLDAATLRHWCEPHGYHFRAKHVVLRDTLASAGRVVLIDTDTFFHRSPLALFEHVRPGTLLCNRIGGRYGAQSEATLYRTLAARLQARGLAADDMALLNSGVIGLDRADAAVLERSLELMDELFPFAEGAYTLEEFVLAVARDEARMALAECPTEIHHYWSRKQIFRAKIDAWLAKHRTAPLSPAALDDTMAVTDALPRPPLPTRLRIKLGTALLPGAQQQFGRELLYGCYPYANEFDRACGPVWWEKAVTNLRERDSDSGSPTELTRWLDGPVLRRLLGSDGKRIRKHLHQRGLI